MKRALFLGNTHYLPVETQLGGRATWTLNTFDYAPCWTNSHAWETHQIRQWNSKLILLMYCKCTPSKDNPKTRKQREGEGRILAPQNHMTTQTKQYKLLKPANKGSNGHDQFHQLNWLCILVKDKFLPYLMSTVRWTSLFTNGEVKQLLQEVASKGHHQNKIDHLISWKRH